MPSLLRLGFVCLLLGSTFSAIAGAGQPRQRTFKDAEEAANALIAAAANEDDAALNAIFGAKASALLTSGDAFQDKAQREEFSKLAAQSHRLEHDAMDANRMILTIGDEQWPFPVPIVRSGGVWIYDMRLGEKTVQARRIGADELDAIEICAGFVAAQEEYARRHGALGYARRLLSSPGKDDGLYSEAHPLVPRIFAESAVDELGKSRPRQYHGYYFRLLTAQGPAAVGGAHDYLVRDLLLGGFALVAWPVQYGVTGVHTFIVNQDGLVYERNLGRPESPLLAPVTEFNPDSDWQPVE